MQDQVLFSTKAIQEDGMDPESAFLPFTGLSTAAMLVLLARWRLDNPRLGGLRGEANRAAATTLLHSLVGGVGWGFSGTLRLRLDSTRFELSWPAAPSHTDVVLPVSGPYVLLDEWRALAAKVDAPFEASAILLECGFDKCQTVPAAGILEKLLLMRKPPWFVVYQVATQAARWIDTSLFKTACGKAPLNFDGSLAKYPGVMDVIDKLDLMNSFLWRHVQGGVVESQASTCLSLTTDAGHCGMKLDCGFFVFQSGKVSVACPQVLCMVGRVGNLRLDLGPEVHRTLNMGSGCKSKPEAGHLDM